MWVYYLGQAIGGIGVILFFTSYLLKNQKQLLLLQTIANGVMFVHYLLIGATSGYVLAIVSIARNIVFYFRDRKYLSSILIPIAFAVIITVVGAFSWQGYYSLFLIVGLAANTIFLSVKNINIVRISVMFTCALILTYNAFVFSIPGMINEAVSIIGAIVGLITYCIKNKK